jgi:hypothetical protein
MSTAEKSDGLLDRLIGWLAPGWAWRRSQFREALRQQQEDAAPRRPDGGGWIRWEDSPLNPERATTQATLREKPREWTW